MTAINRDLKRAAIKEMAELTAKDRKIFLSGASSAAEKRSLASKVSELWAGEFQNQNLSSLCFELMANDNVDANVGTLSGTLVAMEALRIFRYSLKYVLACYTDFREEPAYLGQQLTTRVIITPGVQSYDKTINAQTGLPNGWSFVTPPQSTDVNLMMNNLMGVPIRFGLDIISSTPRKLFKDFAPAAAYALCKNFSGMLLGYITPGNFNAYAQVNGANVPNAYATYPVAQVDFARSHLTKLAAILTKNEVPTDDRFVLLNTDYFSALANDPSITQFFAATQKPEIITEGDLPKMSRFTPFEVPNMPTANNLVGFAGHRASLVAACRPPADLNDIFESREARYGATNFVTDAESGLTMLLAEFVNHVNGYAQWQLMAITGAAPGDKRGGICITSQ